MGNGTSTSGHVLSGWRMVVVGASSGIGREVAIASKAAGASVVAVARRTDLLRELAVSAGLGSAVFAVTADVTSESDCCQAVEEALRCLGGIDVLVYAAGAADLARIEDAGADLWHRVLAVNLVGAAQMVKYSLASLRRSAHPTVVLLSAATVNRPWPWLVHYECAKAGLDELGLGLRQEEPWLRTIRVAVGATATPFADGWDRTRAAMAFERWIAEGYLTTEIMTARHVAEDVVGAIVEPTHGDDIRPQPRPG